VKIQVKDGELIAPLWFRLSRKPLICLTQAAFWLADRLPWFARKLAVNWLAGRIIYHDFISTDQRIAGHTFISDGWFLCMKW
jgi:hypothetical protein